jgi:hypothetical protein
MTFYVPAVSIIDMDTLIGVLILVGIYFIYTVIKNRRK